MKNKQKDTAMYEHAVHNTGISELSHFRTAQSRPGTAHISLAWEFQCQSLRAEYIGNIVTMHTGPFVECR